eukprot:242697-Heterocapsa_arctica.AAC.1
MVRLRRLTCGPWGPLEPPAASAPPGAPRAARLSLLLERTPSSPIKSSCKSFLSPKNKASPHAWGGAAGTAFRRSASL